MYSFKDVKYVTNFLALYEMDMELEQDIKKQLSSLTKRGEKALEALISFCLDRKMLNSALIVISLFPSGGKILNKFWIIKKKKSCPTAAIRPNRTDISQ